MQRKHLATYTFDLTVEDTVDEDQANEALDEIELSRQLLNRARELLAQHGGPLAGVAVVPRHDA